MLNKYFFVVSLIFILPFAACTAVQNEQSTATRLPATAVPAAPANTPTAAPPPTAEAVSPTPADGEQEALVTELETAAPPVGLIYHAAEDGIYQVRSGAVHKALLDEQSANIPNLKVAPDGNHAAYLTEDNKLWLIDIATGEQQQLASGHNLSNYLAWGDRRNLIGGAWLDPSEAESPNNGHITTINIETQEVQILDEEHLTVNRPAFLADYNRVAFDVFSTGPDYLVTGRLYHPDSKLQVFDQSSFDVAGEMISSPLFNPAWAPEGSKLSWLASTGERVAVQVFDMERQTAVQIFDWDPARFGALIPSPMWSPDGQWLVLEVWANDPQETGIWLIAADGHSQTLVDAQGHGPHWTNDGQLVFNVNGSARLYDTSSGESFILDLPQGSTVVGVTSLSDLLAVPASAEPTAEPVPETELPDTAALELANETTIVSPDGRWQATAAQSEPVIAGDLEKFYTTLSVTDGRTTWTPVAEWRGYGLGYLWPTVVQWSEDGRYLYFTNNSSPDGCALFINGTDLYRLDLSDGTVTELLPAGSTGYLALSPDETQVAYTSYMDNQVTLHVRDLENGQEEQIKLYAEEEYAQSAVIWSPDGTQLLATLAFEACNPDWSQSIVRVDLSDKSVTMLIDKDNSLPSVTAWPSAGTATVANSNGMTWLLDVDTGELTPES
jgi:Tol biopolymer transport system component